MTNKKPRQRETSLTNVEVGVIKNLLARDVYKNQDILGIINGIRSQDIRPFINGGRISDVKAGKNSYKTIKALSDKETNDFLKKVNSVISHSNPVDESQICIFFPRMKRRETSLNITETDQIECKESFGDKWTKNCIKVIAAFANNRGGYIAFGVKDRTWEVVGIDENKFLDVDLRVLNQTIRSDLSCAVDFERTTIERAEKKIGIIYIHPAKTKPVIFIRNNTDIGAADGHIYYRYQGENRLIGPTELHNIIEERIRNLSGTILAKHLQNILANGVENSAVMNLITGEVDGKSGSFLIDEKLLPKINFVKEGEFVEKSGAPALKLVGELKVPATVVVTKEENIHSLCPFSYTELVSEVKKRLPLAKLEQINAVIKLQNIKSNSEFSRFVFRNRKQENDYLKLKRVPKSVPSIYSQEAVDLVVEKLR